VNSDGPYRYRPDVLQRLAAHGLRPTSWTPPDVARGYVRDLYKYEIRVLKARLLKHEFPRHEYNDRVVALRNRYDVLALLPRQFVEGT
jgi:hypothetical protein